MQDWGIGDGMHALMPQRSVGRLSTFCCSAVGHDCEGKLPCACPDLCSPRSGAAYAPCEARIPQRTRAPHDSLRKRLSAYTVRAQRMGHRGGMFLLAQVRRLRHAQRLHRRHTGCGGKCHRLSVLTCAPCSAHAPSQSSSMQAQIFAAMQAALASVCSLNLYCRANPFGEIGKHSI